MGNSMRDEWELTLTIKTFDGNPKHWDWNSLTGDELIITKSEFKRRVLEDAEPNWDTYTFTCDPSDCDALIQFTARDGFGFPNGVVGMKCACGKEMNYISRERKS